MTEHDVSESVDESSEAEDGLAVRTRCSERQRIVKPKRLSRQLAPAASPKSDQIHSRIIRRLSCNDRTAPLQQAGHNQARAVPWCMCEARAAGGNGEHE
jgi:hypothetical protein